MEMEMVVVDVIMINPYYYHLTVMEVVEVLMVNLMLAMVEVYLMH
jgi:hypothetical protein